MSAVMRDPEPSQFRGTFRTRYAMGADRYQRRKKTRLMDLNTAHCLVGDSRYFTAVEEGEFCVVDVKTREKAWFEWLPGLEVMDVHSLIEGHFGDAAFRVGARMWFV